MSTHAAVKKATERARRNKFVAQRSAYGLAPLPRYESWYIFDPVAAQQEAAAGGWSPTNRQPASAVVVPTAPVAAGNSSISTGYLKKTAASSTAKVGKRKRNFVHSGDDEDDDDYEDDINTSSAINNMSPTITGTKTEGSATRQTVSPTKPKSKAKHKKFDSDYQDGEERSASEPTPSRTSTPRRVAAPTSLALPQDSVEEEDVSSEEVEAKHDFLPSTITREGLLKLLAITRRNLANRPDALRGAENTIKDEMRYGGFLGKGEDC